MPVGSDVSWDEIMRARSEQKPEDECAPKNMRQEAKPQMSLLPLDVLQEFLIPAYMEGLEKYWRDSWRKGFKTSVMIDAALRHIEAFYWGHEDYDPDAAELGVMKHHLAGAVFSLLTLMHSLKYYPHLDDRTDPYTKEESWDD